jgi:hypothetical protein
MIPSTDDIVIQKRLLMNHKPAELIIQKPGEANGGSGKIIILYGTDLTNLVYILSTLKSEGLTIEKINEINPYFRIDKVETVTTSEYAIPKNYKNLLSFIE